MFQINIPKVHRIKSTLVFRPFLYGKPGDFGTDKFKFLLESKKRIWNSLSIVYYPTLENPKTRQKMSSYELNVHTVFVSPNKSFKFRGIKV